MTIIIDRRNVKSSKNSSNRSRFIKRYKKYIKESLEKVMEKKSIEDSNEPVDVPIDWDIKETDIGFDKETGERECIISGNDEYEKGDCIDKESSENESGTNGEIGNDSFTITLTKEEFFDIYFYDMELPDFIKESMIDSVKDQYKRAGYIKDGIPSRIDILKTLQMSIARRISNKNKDKKPPFIDDIDLRYKHYINVPQPMLKAVMFCCMDVSGSMDQHHKFLSKKFFTLLYLFLIKNYKSVDLRFIRYHHLAKDVDETAFFYDTETGGTQVMEGLNLINDIIMRDYPLHIYNIYIAHTSDGDIGHNDDEDIVSFIDNELIPKIQYYAYLQVQDADQFNAFEGGYRKLYGILEESSNIGKKLNIETVLAEEDIFPVLQNLFKKEK